MRASDRVFIKFMIKQYSIIQLFLASFPMTTNEFQYFQMSIYILLSTDSLPLLVWLCIMNVWYLHFNRQTYSKYIHILYLPHTYTISNKILYFLRNLLKAPILHLVLLLTAIQISVDSGVKLVLPQLLLWIKTKMEFC